MTVSGEGDAVGKWASERIKAITIPADAPAGLYQVLFPHLPVWIHFPLSDVDTPEVIVTENGDFSYQSGFSDYSFFVQQGTTSFVIELPAFSSVGIWGPDGRNVWWQTDYADDPERYSRAVIDVPAGMDGRIWRITVSHLLGHLSLPSAICYDCRR